MRPSPFRGFRRPPSRVRRVGCTKVGQFHGAHTGLTAQCRIVAGMASPEGLAEQRRDTIPSVPEGRHGVDSPLTWAPACVRTLNAPIGGVGTGAASP
jgi:hypothetical protein